MTLNLQELGQLVRTVARERRLDAEVLGVTPTEGDGHYAEVLIDLSSPSTAAQRVSLGFQRDAVHKPAIVASLFRSQKFFSPCSTRLKT